MEMQEIKRMDIIERNPCEEIRHGSEEKSWNVE